MDFAVAWNRIYLRLKDKDNRHQWKVAKGPMAATILTLQIIGWQAVAPNKFIEENDNVWLLNKNNGTMQDILDAILASAIQVTDNQAMGSHMGSHRSVNFGARRLNQVWGRTGHR